MIPGRSETSPVIIARVKPSRIQSTGEDTEDPLRSSSVEAVVAVPSVDLKEDDTAVWNDRVDDDDACGTVRRCWGGNVPWGIQAKHPLDAAAATVIATATFLLILLDRSYLSARDHDARVCYYSSLLWLSPVFICFNICRKQQTLLAIRYPKPTRSSCCAFRATAREDLASRKGLPFPRDLASHQTTYSV